VSKPAATRVFPFAEAAAAENHLVHGRQLGQVVLSTS